MKNFRRIAALAALGLVLINPAAAAGGGFVDPLDAASPASPLAARNLINGLARAGGRIVAVGQRGHIAVSADGGTNWKKVSVPVSSDLVSVFFPTAASGWAVGHDGVVIASADGGETWARQFDGRAAALVMATQHASAAPGLADEAKRYAEQGPDKPFLDVFFENERTGYVVGAFNLIFRTDDGGKSWQSWFDRTDNPLRLHLHAVRSIGGELFVVGEQGLVLKLDRAAGRLRALETPYQGSYFGITGKAGAVIAYGLRGNAWRSVDGGKRWSKIDLNVPSAITAADVGADGSIVLASQGGTVLRSTDDGASFRPLAIDPPSLTFAVLAAGRDELVLAGLRGLRVVPVKPTHQGKSPWQ